MYIQHYKKTIRMGTTSIVLCKHFIKNQLNTYEHCKYISILRLGAVNLLETNIGLLLCRLYNSCCRTVYCDNSLHRDLVL